MSEDRVYFSRIADPETWVPAEYVDRLEWKGWYVFLDGDTVRFGNDEDDWVKPYGKDGTPRRLDGARLADNGRLLIVSGGPYEFVFYDVVRHIADEKFIGFMFLYRWRYKSRVRRGLLRVLNRALEVVR